MYRMKHYKPVYSFLNIKIDTKHLKRFDCNLKALVKYTRPSKSPFQPPYYLEMRPNFGKWRITFLINSRLTSFLMIKNFLGSEGIGGGLEEQLK